MTKRLHQLDACYAEFNKSSVCKRTGGNNHVSSQNETTRCAHAHVCKSDSSVCVIRNEVSHAVHLCSELTKLSVADRRSKVQSVGLRYNCLGQGQRVSYCK